MKKLLILLGILTPIILLGYFSYKFLYSDNLKSAQEDKDIPVSELKIIAEAWKNADIPGDKVCKPYQNVDSSFYQCNEQYFSCLLAKGLLKTKRDKKQVSFKMLAKPTLLIRPTYKSFKYSLGILEQVVDLELKDSCLEIYLPRRIYQTFALDRELVVEWDNNSQNIFVDKYLVRVKDLKGWIELQDKKLAKKVKGKKPFELVTNFLPSDMKKFCEDHGKRLISSRVWDAMSIHPDNISNPMARNARTPYYPWSRKNTATQIFFLQKNKKRLNKKTKRAICKKVYGRDCLKEFHYKHQEMQTVTWMGAFEVMGGAFEYVDNIINPSENIKLSSVYYDLKSYAHRVGQRGFWDGQGFAENNFVFKKYKPEGNEAEYKVAFRCMRLR